MTRIFTIFLALVIFLSDPSNATMTPDQQDELVNRVMSAPKIPTFDKFVKRVKKDPLFKGLVQDAVHDIFFEVYYKNTQLEWDRTRHELWSLDQIKEAEVILEGFSPYPVGSSVDHPFNKVFLNTQKKMQEMLAEQKERSVALILEYNEDKHRDEPEYEKIQRIFSAYHAKSLDPLGVKSHRYPKEYAIHKEAVKRIYDKYTEALETLTNPLLRAVCLSLRSGYYIINDEPIEISSPGLSRSGDQEPEMPFYLKIAIRSSQISLLDELERAAAQNERTNLFLSARILMMGCFEAESYIDEKLISLENHKNPHPDFEQAQAVEKTLHSRYSKLWDRLFLLLDGLECGQIYQLMSFYDSLTAPNIKYGCNTDGYYPIVKSLFFPANYMLEEEPENRSGLLWTMKALCCKESARYLMAQYQSYDRIQSINYNVIIYKQEFGELEAAIARISKTSIEESLESYEHYIRDGRIERETAIEMISKNRKEFLEKYRKQLLDTQEYVANASAIKTSAVEEFRKTWDFEFKTRTSVAVCLERVANSLANNPQSQLELNMIVCQYLLENIEGLRKAALLEPENLSDPWQLEFIAIMKKSCVAHAESIRTFFEKVIEQSKTVNKALAMNVVLVNLHVGLSVLADKPSQAEEYLQMAEDLSVAAITIAREEKSERDETLKALKPFTRDKAFFNVR